jgi:hypothetical protein
LSRVRTSERPHRRLLDLNNLLSVLLLLRVRLC